MSDEHAGYVDVALPVPLRRTFTYAVPPALRGRVLPGTRVAVPFARRKAVGIVLARREAPPEGVARIMRVAGLLEDEPLFPAELLAFLDEAARYYMHPVGEVLRAAAPALPRGALARLRKEGFLTGEEGIKGAAVKVREEVFVRATDATREGRLGTAQARVLALVDARVEVGLSELRIHVKTARAVVRKLEERGLVRCESREVLADRFSEVVPLAEAPPVATAAQEHAVRVMVDALAAPTRPFLLHGVTGSGKTEVYLRVMDAARALGRGGLLLVPEIALTPQLVGRFRARFGNEIAVLHSGLGEKERDDYWRALRRGQLRIAVGARSALFAPIPDLGVIVVDEEHDPSFKQEEGFRYHARDMAVLRAHRASAVCILGSATPSLESFRHAREGRFELVSLPQRATGQVMPDVELLDLRRLKPTTPTQRYLSEPLLRALRACLADKGQAILFLNRRGYSPSMQCAACDELAGCPACSVPLTEHRREGALRCHYCDYAEPSSDPCRACGAQERVPLGLGTEKLEDELAQLLYPAKVARLDRDTASGEGVEQVLERVRAGEIDVLVGTQMVTKGHDIANVTLVGVLLADQSLAFPDFRGSERTFQLLAQVAGRAGRGARAGRVLVQTYQPEHHAIASAARHDYEAFYEAELAQRSELGYAPFGRMVAVRVDAPEEDLARRVAESLASEARRHPALRDHRVALQGPAPAPLAKVRARYRYRFLLRGEDRRALREVAQLVLAAIERGVAPARASVDIDPVSMM
ncbi:MAG: primosomal protein N' [Sandaracinaceae bacterium]|nr:primosomal protein N' [Sandaracinaceae bacterium]